MEDCKKTWTGLPDLPDQPVSPRDVGREQAHNMRAILGVELWDWLEKETENE